ncbi:MAG: hypothetical protein J0I42_01855 [Bosea sp.]|uniref:hypothetical protein n=1 Tax=Bosea sp. (in: a-proteobacteria) TaxID=1871050 RepID=UPI001AC734DA|nr:hypothetical protein [Bosea sp. (in: a-proteobacteria)]MBN9450669.1 hypothetical protein [Bosea sp. (in: a-proteobacteria)]
MGDARSLTPLSQADYEAIEAAVMETARGRWFMVEYAKRNRQADTLQLLGAIQRIERVVGLGVQETSRETNLIEAAALISDLRTDLERISGKAEARSSGLAAQIEKAAGAVLAATEGVQEAAWGLRETGADVAACDMLDRRAAEISTAIGVVDSVVQRIDKIADTIAMLDSSLRAFGEVSRESSVSFEAMAATTDTMIVPPPSAAPRHYDDLDIATDGHAPVPLEFPDRMASEARFATVQLLDDDIVFSDSGNAHPEPARPAATPSESALRDIDALPAERKLAYFV